MMNACVLLVDDIEENLIALEALLRRLPDIEIVTARSGREALELLLQKEVALALLDVNMPEMDGFQLAELMRGSARTKDIPIVFVTAAHDPQRVFQGYDAGAIDFMIKPVDPRILQSKVATLLELYRSRAQLAAQSRQLQELLRTHETFVAAVNHDLRTPLHTISVGATLLAGEAPSGEQKEVHRRVEAAIDRMSGMLDQLYDLARSRVGSGITIEAAPGDLAEICRRVAHEVELRGKGMPIEVVTDGNTKGAWDLTRISRVAANLISNALQHGDRATGIKVSVDGRAADRVTLVVHNGGAIPGELQATMFEPFRRAATPGSSHKGLGLGLYIVREIVHAHGGSVAMASSADAGTSFTVTLPRIAG